MRKRKTPLKYVALISCRNEEKNIKATVEAILRQKITPSAVVIVDDNSTDLTGQIISQIPGVTKVTKKNPRSPIRGVNLALALNAGLEKIKEIVPDWDYLLKVDADSILPSSYVEKLIEKFRVNHLNEAPLGIASGNPQDEKVWRGRASDGAKIFSRKCLDSIGIFPICNAFDTLMLLRAYYHGWRVESYEDIKYYQSRSWQRGNIGRWILSGRSRYFLGFPVWHTFLIALIYMPQKPYVIGSFSMFFAHFLTWIGGYDRPWSEEFYFFVKCFALKELMDRWRSQRNK